ncbi:MAG TPA: glycosyltransferase family 4 protein [Bacteroidales bacterium]|jgi:glycosyltransferase involved in cell wall biosynthesis|nr:glycosyltransferase [Bacteroidales bacterium]MBP7873876.1 glycosyltransferase [Bacteroidales bacterium]MCZ2283325.1 glycosyltransferase family 4 protein [Bacteroidales bacterium]HPX34839.1 glycosyltransferase family 4 protein [Bacteroidales bacterium]
MKILILCNKSPYPPKEGGPIAMNAIIEGLIEAGHQVKVLAINTNKYFIKENDIPESYRQKTGIETVYIDLSIKPLDALLNLFSKDSYHVQRFISKEFEKKLISILQNDTFDIVQLETLYISPFIETIRENSKAKIVLRAHNIEHLIWERVAEISSNPLKKLYLKHLAKKLKNYELEIISKYDGIATITSKDASSFKNTGCEVPIISIPFGIDLEKIKEKPGIKAEFPSLFHIGAMNWMPNIEGIKWFLDKVWPLIQPEFPNLKFYIAGRSMPSWLYQKQLPNVEIVGEVPDAFDFMYSKAIEIVPLFSGSGIRIKIIEGMAVAKAIISTTIGAEGINVTHEKNILLADDPIAFANAVKRCVNDEQFVLSLGTNARELIRNEHSNKQIIEKLTKFYHSLVLPQ